MLDFTKGFAKFADNYFERKTEMARIIEGERRIIKMSVDDVLNIVREYQQITHNSCCYEHTRELLAKADFFVPEEK